ncbi:MAG TPA: hypothetical protein VJA21_01820 [Verrucomicrobiae bacterium]
MRITSLIGLFFLVLAAVFGLAARADYRRSHSRWSPAGITHRRIAVIFGIVGLSLLVWGIA